MVNKEEGSEGGKGDDMAQRYIFPILLFISGILIFMTNGNTPSGLILGSGERGWLHCAIDALTIAVFFGSIMQVSRHFTTKMTNEIFDGLKWPIAGPLFGLAVLVQVVPVTLFYCLSAVKVVYRKQMTGYVLGLRVMRVLNGTRLFFGAASLVTGAIFGALYLWIKCRDRGATCSKSCI
jgi:hypothetical protein